MREFFDVETWRVALTNSLNELAVTVARFLPKLLGALVVLAIGWAVSKIVEAIACRLLRQFGLDRAVERVGLARTLDRAGLREPASRLVGRVLFWVLMLTFVLTAVQTLGLEGVAPTIDRLIAYLPNVIAAGLILVIGLLLGRFARNVVSSAAAAANLVQAPRLGAAANTLVVLVVAVLVLEQLGVETRLLTTVITAFVATLGLTMGVAFALGSRGIVTHILAGHYLRQSFASGDRVEVGGRAGVVERVGAVDTLFREDQRRWSMPNGQLLEEVVTR